MEKEAAAVAEAATARGRDGRARSPAPLPWGRVTDARPRGEGDRLRRHRNTDAPTASQPGLGLERRLVTVVALFRVIAAQPGLGVPKTWPPLETRAAASPLPRMTGF